MRRIVGAAAVAFAISQLALPAYEARADAIADFYKSKPMVLSVGSAVGSGFTIYARLISRHMPRYIPGAPTIVIENLPGASGLRHMDHLVTVAPKDGSTIGLLNPSVAAAPLLTPELAKHRSDKLAWIGSANSEVSTCMFWPHVNVKDIEDLKTRELVIGGSGAAGSSGIGAEALRSIFGFKWKIISGYQGSADIMIAGARREIDGACILLMSALRAQYWEQFQRGEFKIMLQMPPGNHPDLPGVINTIDLAQNEEQRLALEFIYGYWAFGRPFAAPAGVPADRLQVLRAALKATLEDPQFLADSKKIGVSVDYMGHAELDRRVKAIENTPASVVAKVRALVPAHKAP
jgi:tripartite-type tricarboxylate transporter receptor subunit TctC